MSLKSKMLLLVFGWLVLISAMHGYLNVNWAAVLNDYRPPAKRKITVAYMPVTCQLTCPVDRLHLEILPRWRAVSSPPVPGLSRDQGSTHLQQGTGGIHCGADGDCP